MIFLFGNAGAAELVASITGASTSLQLGSGQGLYFPAPAVGQGIVVVVQSGSTWEVMLVTAKSGDVLTVTRAQEGTAASSFPIGATVEMRVTKGLLENFVQRGQAKEEAFASGTRALFQQTTAPLFWTKDVSAIDDRALRVVTGSVGSGGTLAFSSAFISRPITGTVQSTTLTTGQMPVHSHPISPVEAASNIALANAGTYFVYPQFAGPGNFIGYAGLVATNAGSGGSHTHGLSMNNLDMAVRYLDAIVAVKD